ncbi:hypothetical protein KI387_009776 [Taxus chinensis]|uniref:Uncharacterized protein n=1 Tax=Taxus chinensis TaxID=29808 RepID=A0AA38FJW2_TAXCH|nr:hypothetical protein KI387_009776 [Taxus chinensis]
MSLGMLVAQVNLKFKLLGLKATLRKRKSGVRCSNAEDENTEVGLQDKDDFNEIKLLKTSEKQKSPKKMESYVFNEQQERLMIVNDVDNSTGVGDEDDLDHETLMTGLLKSQDTQLQKRKVAEVCNKFFKEFGIAEYCMDKDDNIVPVVGVEGDTDDELLVGAHNVFSVYLKLFHFVKVGFFFFPCF